jgi:hypothetical protein
VVMAASFECAKNYESVPVGSVVAVGRLRYVPPTYLGILIG